MTDLSRRTFVAASIGGIAATAFPAHVAMAAQCVTGGLPDFLPNSLTVDCASKRNFRVFRQYSDQVGLAGAVSMSFVRGRYGSYPAGNLFLFPWLKPKAKGQNLPGFMPADLTQVVNASPLPDATLPVDECLCRNVLQAPWQSFIGFEVNKSYSAGDAQRDWFSNVDKLADGAGVGIDWTSSNLNNAWFGGSHWIPKSDTCNGNAWRQLIIAGLNQASTGTC